jgi:RNA polymerase sigma-70 factor (ECF subfamily)
MSDQSAHLLLATRRGDQSAARALWHLHAARLTAYARSIIRARSAPHDADDIVQSAFCRIMLLSEPDLSSVRDTGAWLAQLTRNAALNWLRTHRRDAARRERTAALTPSRSPASADHALAEAVDALPARLREVIVLKHIAGLTFDQIELATGINRNTAAARYRSAISLLRETLDPAQPEASSIPSSSSRQNLVHHA